MTTRSLPPPAPPPAPPADWPATATRKLVDTVDLVRAKATDPAIKVGRGIVYGLLIAILSVPAVALACVFLIRIVDVYVPGDVYWAYLIVGGVLLLSGIIVWSQRTRKPPPEEA
jgi:hypothetical protein